MAGTLTNAGLNKILDNWTSSTDFPLTFGLFKNDYTPTPFTTLADLVVADYTGYPPQIFPGTTSRKNDQPDGSAARFSASLFSAHMPATPNTIYGAYLARGVSPFDVLAAARFDVPRSLTTSRECSLEVLAYLGLEKG